MSNDTYIPHRNDQSFLNSTWFKLIHVEKVLYSGQEWLFRKDQLIQHRIIICSRPCRVIVDGVRIHAISGTVIVCHPGQWVETGGPSKEEQTMYFLEFEQGQVAGGEMDQDITAKLEFRTFEYRIPATVHLGNIVHSYWERATSADLMRAQAGFYELLSLLVEQQECRDMEAPDFVKEEIDRRYQENLSVDDLAMLSRVSRYQLMRNFKERYGKSIVEYLTEVRLQHAKKLMLENRLSIGEISDQVGFGSEQYFRTVFKKKVGIAPGVYLHNRRHKVAAYSWPILGQLLPLQVVPHAAPLDHYWTDEFSRKYSSDIAVPLGHHYDFNRRVLRQMKPDCIIGLNSTISPDEAASLGEIAPVLLLPWMEADWRQHLWMVADFLEMTEVAASWLERYEQKTKSVREQIHNIVLDEKVLVLKVAGNDLQIWGRKALTVLYDDLGLAPASLVKDIDWYAPVKLERLSEYEENCRFIVNVNGDFHSQLHWKRLQEDKQWNGLKQVRENTIHLQQGHQAWVYPWFENSALYQDRLLDRTAQLILCKHL